MKNTTVVISESGEIHDLTIQPATTAREVLGQVGLGAAYSYVVLVVVIALASIFIRYMGGLQRKREGAPA